MPLAHACPGCGHVLTRTRAAYDHAFRAPVVVCPECSLAAVRRRHPVSAAMRLWWRRAWSAYGLTWRSLLTLVLALGTTILCFQVGSVLSSAGLTVPEAAAHLARIADHESAWDSLTENGGRVPLVMGACWAVLAGAILTGGLTHLRHRWIPWVLFIALVLLCIWTPTLYELWERLERGDEPSLFTTEGLHADESLAATHVLAALIPLMLLGTPLGFIACRALLRRDVRRFARRRARVQARRFLA